MTSAGLISTRYARDRAPHEDEHDGECKYVCEKMVKD